MLYNKIINRYIAKEFILYFLLSSFIIVTSIMFLAGIEVIVNSSVKLSFKKSIYFILSNLPVIIEFVLPITTLLSAMILFSHFNDKHEVVALLGSGLSTVQIFLKPVIPILFAIALFLYFNQSYLTRYLDTENSIYQIQNNQQNWVKDQTGFLYFTDQGSQEDTIYQLSVKNNSLTDIRIYQDQSIQDDKTTTEALTYKLGQKEITKKSEMLSAENIYLQKLDKIKKSELRFLPLLSLIKIFKKNQQQKINNVRVQYYITNKISFLFTPFVMYYLAFPFSIYQSRSTKKGQIIVFGLITGFLYLIFNQFSYLLFNADIIHYFVGGIGVNTSFFLGSVLLYLIKQYKN